MFGRACGLALAAILVGGTFGCSPSGGSPRSTAAEPHPSATPASEPCRVQLPAAWRSALNAGTLPATAGETLLGFAAAPDAQRVFASSKSDTWSGVVAMDSRGTKRQRIKAFAHPERDQVINGHFDGRWLVWTESHSLSDLSDWTVHAWDGKTGTVTQISAAHRRHGKPVPGGLVQPVVDQGMLAWTQSSANGGADVHLYSLADRRDRVVFHGNAGPPILAWPMLLWPVSDIANQPGRLLAASAQTGQRLPTPAPLAPVRGPTFLGAAGDTVAWSSWDYRELWTWTRGASTPTKLTSAPAGDFIEFPEIGNGPVVAWTGSTAAYVSDLRTGTTAAVTGSYGFAHATGSALLVNFTAGSGEGVPVQRTSIVDIRTLAPLPSAGPGCSARSPG